MAVGEITPAVKDWLVPAVKTNLVAGAALTVKVEVAEFEVASVAVTVWEPVDAPDGTVKVTPVGIAPAAEVVTVAGVVVIVVVSNFTVIVDEAAKPGPGQSD